MVYTEDRLGIYPAAHLDIVGGLKMTFDQIIKEVRADLADRGWKLYLYKKKGLIKSVRATGICDEEAKYIAVATKRLQDYQVLWYLAHEFAHFQQVYDFKKYSRAEVDKAYWRYDLFVDEGKPLYLDQWKKSREIVVEYEFDADVRASYILENWGARVKGFKKDANAYSYTLRFAFHEGYWMQSGREKLSKKFGLPDRWFTKRERQRRLKKSELEYMEKLHRSRRTRT